MAFRVTTPAAEEPVSLSDAKDHLNVIDTDDDRYIEGLIARARRHTEIKIQRSLITQTCLLTLDSFPAGRVIELPRPPLVSVTSVKYDDSSGTEQTLSSSIYSVDTESAPGRVALDTGQSWPTTIDNVNAVRVVYVAGYGDADDLKEKAEDLIQGILFLVGHWYANREPVAVRPGITQVEIPDTFYNIVMPYRVY